MPDLLTKLSLPFISFIEILESWKPCYVTASREAIKLEKNVKWGGESEVIVTLIYQTQSVFFSYFDGFPSLDISTAVTTNHRPL